MHGGLRDGRLRRDGFSTVVLKPGTFQITAGRENGGRSDALDAAHIYPYRGTKTNLTDNGLIMRADIHTLFDLYLLGIRPSDHRIVLAPKLRKGVTQVSTILNSLAVAET